MKIALIGYGKMGKTIESLLPELGHEVGAIVDVEGDFDTIESCDVAIEFSKPEAAVKNILNCTKLGIPVVVGTTGWYNEFEQVKEKIEEANSALFYATNFSIGVNLFWATTEKMAKWLNNHPSYKVAMKEIHHTHKLDSPSGTAITTAEKLVEHLDAYTGWRELPETEEGKIPIEALRKGEVFGTHEINFESEIDKLVLRHEAKSRAGFARGAILAAEFIHGKKGIFTMSDMLTIN